ncbi:hypothetical protein P154DRAFT_285601 [Amniculicola lignicola CBS 123094]|uniref:DUF7703 domain-containing protein n=1 Tax=Amniculicola lignicola CBS 123094 TaxID=1392246 RepID=A0A6A5WXG4_9PLEO|nr:hypothetical protein P154DRAFT_285601 [Amniculicola lignicola CBS 123094]
MESVEELKGNLPMSMTMAAFVGIALYICVELNIRLFLTFRRRRGLYFWSCALASWGVLIQPLATTMADFGVWENKLGSMMGIYLSWWVMVVPQSLVLYSGLHLVMSNTKHLRWVLYMIIFTTVVFSIPTIIVGILAQTTMSGKLRAPYMIWDKIQVTAFFVQEIIISLLYISETRERLKRSTILRNEDSQEVFNHLIYVNVLVMFLDCSLLALTYAGFFYVQGAYKPCIYGVKLRIEYSILNRLIQSVQPSAYAHFNSNDTYKSSGKHSSWGLGPKVGEGKHESFSCRSNQPSQLQSGLQIVERRFDAERASMEITPYEGHRIVQTTEISVQAVWKSPVFPERR